MSNIHRIKCGNGNCYIIENGSGGVLVDTGKREYAERVLERCRAYRVGLIILTHGHFDHAENAARISRELGIPIGMSELDRNLIESNNSQELSAGTFLGKIVLSVSLWDFSRREMQRFKPEVLLKDVMEKHLIVGDALMNMFYPTVSMLYHDRRDMLESAKKISALGDRTIYFGHGGPVRNRRWVRS